MDVATNADTSMLVAGGGPAGTSAALQAHELGAHVTLLEADLVGGSGSNALMPRYHCCDRQAPVIAMRMIAKSPPTRTNKTPKIRAKRRAQRYRMCCYTMSKRSVSM